ncbi:hypothetical protein YYC_02820 [Plasmodium yoelii 17X]|uniref:Plasmodium variant antigen protein Cir/Yir/Bir n=1 Tax=Plasmodium yoelii 17X TaxID=1323249 RepID=V7PK84_PLAYE|nr:hypothetical protein YYC_02820 [Plasmodium yoelii 17X]
MQLLNSSFSDCNFSNDEQKIISGFIMLIHMLGNLESDKIVQYSSLWLSHKLNQKTQNGTTKLYDFYTENIITNSCYINNIDDDSDDNINKSDIGKKINMMNMDIKDISNFYDAFKSLCNMYSERDATTECKTCLENAGELFEKYEKLKNALDINKEHSYYELLSSLSNDYKNFENKYNYNSIHINDYIFNVN